MSFLALDHGECKEERGIFEGLGVTPASGSGLFWPQSLAGTQSVEKDFGDPPGDVRVVALHGLRADDESLRLRDGDVRARGTRSLSGGQQISEQTEEIRLGLRCDDIDVDAIAGHRLREAEVGGAFDHYRRDIREE